MRKKTAFFLFLDTQGASGGGGNIAAAALSFCVTKAIGKVAMAAAIRLRNQSPWFLTNQIEVGIAVQSINKNYGA